MKTFGIINILGFIYFLVYIASQIFQIKRQRKRKFFLCNYYCCNYKFSFYSLYQFGYCHENDTFQMERDHFVSIVQRQQRTKIHLRCFIANDNLNVKITFNSLTHRPWATHEFSNEKLSHTRTEYIRKKKLNDASNQIFYTLLYV